LILILIFFGIISWCGHFDFSFTHFNLLLFRNYLSFNIYTFPANSPYGELSGADTGIEVAIRGNEDDLDQWIPIKYFHAGYDRQEAIKVGKYNDEPEDYFIIRGHRVPAQTLQINDNAISVEFCEDRLLATDNLQFRWLQTVRFHEMSQNRHVWRLNNIKVCFQNESVPLL